MLVAVFQWGWGEGLLNFRSNGGIAQWLPIFMFVILFGLSMDYHVFILSRIREAYDRGAKTERRDRPRDQDHGGCRDECRGRDGRRVPDLRDAADRRHEGDGVGLAAAVLIDATIVRAFLLPASMKLLGEWNWYLPNWLGWLPRLDHGAGIAAPAPAAAAAAALEMSA